MSYTSVSNLSDEQRVRLGLKIRLEQEKRRRLHKKALAAPSDWQDWLTTLFPSTFTAAFADRHVSLWQWLEGLEAKKRPSPLAYVDVEPRGGGKTTTAETAVVRLGAKESRQFILYVRSTQDKANESITSISTKLESKEVGQYYPILSQRHVGKYGHSKGWNMEMLRCANGFNVLGLGLDAAVRGVKLDDFRPDLIVFDDIDDEHDSWKVIKRKIDIITKSIIPAGAVHCAYLITQNLIHAYGIVTSLVDGVADFLHDRIVSGPHKAVDGLTYEKRPLEPGYTITGGVATWAGQDINTCEQQINAWGLSSFLREAQHEVEEGGGIWEDVTFQHVAYDALPDFVVGSVWVDPAVTSTDDSDCQAMIAGGVDAGDVIHVVYCSESVDTPLNVIKRAILKCVEWGFSSVGIETDQGGDTWDSVYEMAWQSLLKDEHEHILNRERAAEKLSHLVTFDAAAEAYVYRNGEWIVLKRPLLLTAKAGSGHGSKVERNQRMLLDYERGRVVHMNGAHILIEKSLRRFPLKPLDLADAGYWLWYHLRNRPKPAPQTAVSSIPRVSKWSNR